MEANPALWLSAVSQSRVRDTFCSYGVMELCTKGLGSSVHALKARGVSLACVRTCVVVAEERPRIALTTSFSKLFSALGLSPRAVSTSFGCRVNTAICLQVRLIIVRLIEFYELFINIILLIILLNRGHPVQNLRQSMWIFVRYVTIGYPWWNAVVRILCVWWKRASYYLA